MPEASELSAPQPLLIVPIGTRIVTRIVTRVATRATDSGDGGARPAGAVGAIVAAPTDAQHAYRVRFADGVEVALRRSEFAILKQYQRALAPDDLYAGEQDDEVDGATGGDTVSDLEIYERYIIYRCIVGSRAYGLDRAASDVDRRGMYLPPADLVWSLAGVPEQLQDAESDQCYWEAEKFLALALKANPNILECLYTPLVESASPLAQELREMRGVFLSKLIYQSYGGYVFSQFKKLEQDLRAHGTIRWKHAMHLIRLLLSGITALREGYVPVAVGERRAELLAIRDAAMPWEEVNAWRLDLHRQFDTAYQATKLPDRPDYAQANAFLLRARRSSV